MKQIKHFRYGVAIVSLVALFAASNVAFASHSWGSYHWARTSNPFTLKLGDNVSSAWDTYLATASADWSLSSVLDTTIVAGSTRPKPCRAKSGRVEVCAAAYGKTGWLGVATIWISGSHITQGTVKVNDTYFKAATYNAPAWKQFVMCQEVGHTFGLDHQDEDFNNPNLGSCMDYTSDPSSNQHPNAHDYEQLEAIYAHLDSTTTIASITHKGNGADSDFVEASEWGKEVRKSSDGKTSLFTHDLGRGEKAVTFVIWANAEVHN